MRDLVLAKQFKDDNIIFATQDLDGNINHKIIEQSYKLEILKSNSLAELTNIIEMHSINTVVIDSYDIDYTFERKLKEKTSVEIFTLDDTYEKHHCDILLNHNIYADEKRYKKLVPDNCELRCGKRFTLLRDEFIQEKNKNNKISREDITVLVAMGGADNLNLNVKILDVLSSIKNIYVDIVTSSANANLETLKEYVENKENISLHIDTNKMAFFMNKSDLAIVTPSVTLNEVIFMNLPFIAIKTAANQIYMYEYLVKKKYFAMDKFDSNKIKIFLKGLIDAK